MKIMPSFVTLLNEFIYKCTKKSTDYYIAKAMLEKADVIKETKIDEISYTALTTDASVSKFCRKLGYDGYSAIKASDEGYDLISSHRNSISTDNYREYLNNWSEETAGWYKECFDRICTLQFEEIARELAEVQKACVITGILGFAGANIFATSMNLRNITVYEINRDADEALIEEAGSESEMVFVISLTGKWYQQNKKMLDPKKTIVISYHSCEDSDVRNIVLDTIPNLFSSHFNSTSSLILFFTALDAAVSTFQNQKVKQI